MKSAMIAVAATVLLMAGAAQSSAQESYGFLVCGLEFNESGEGLGTFNSVVLGVEVEGKTTVALPAVGDTCTSALAQLGQGKLCILDGIFFHDESQLPGVLESAATTKPIVGIKEILLAECGKL